MLRKFNSDRAQRKLYALFDVFYSPFPIRPGTVTSLTGKLPSLDAAAVMVIGAGDNTMTFKLKTPSKDIRYTAILTLCDQQPNFIGMYAIGVSEVTEKITKISGTDASISRSGDSVIVSFNSSGIWSSGILIAPREYAE